MVKQYDLYRVSLNPTLGSEINKTRPCLVISPDEANKHLNTYLIAPITSNFEKVSNANGYYFEEETGSNCP